MTKSMTTTITYPAALDRVQTMLFDTRFREQVAAAQHVVDGHVSISGSGTGAVVTVSQQQSMDRAPGFVQKVVGSTLSVISTETWTSATSADLHVDLPGKPVTMTGKILLSESAGVTTETIDLTVKVAMPLVGGKVEDLIATIFSKAYAKDESVGAEWLKEG